MKHLVRVASMFECFGGGCFSTIGNAFFKNKVFSDRVRNRDNCPKGALSVVPFTNLFHGFAY